MFHRVHPGLRHVRVAGEVPAGIEFRDRADRPVVAMRQEMREAELAGGHRIGPSVPGRIEMQYRAPAFLLAVADVVQQRIGVARADIGILGAVPCRIEIRIWLPAVAPAFGHVVAQRVFAAAWQVAAAGQVERRVEQA